MLSSTFLLNKDVLGNEPKKPDQIERDQVDELDKANELGHMDGSDHVDGHEVSDGAPSTDDDGDDGRFMYFG